MKPISIGFYAQGDCCYERIFACLSESALIFLRAVHCTISNKHAGERVTANTLSRAVGERDR